MSVVPGTSSKYGYSVSINRDRTSYESSDDRYGDWSESWENTFESVAKGGTYPDVVSIHDLKERESAFVVWVEYSHGDSFGHSNKGNVEVVGLFKDKSVAEELKAALIDYEKHKPDKQWDDRYSFHFKTSDGQEFNYSFVPWSGYFENLDEVHIEETKIK